MDLSVDFCGIRLKNPLIAGSCDYSRSISRFQKVVESGVAAIVMKSLTNVESLQNPKIAKFLCLNDTFTPWKYGEPVGGFYSRGGAMLSQPEWNELAAEAPALARKNNVLLIGSICASGLAIWRRMAKKMEDTGLQAIELNLGNPHFAVGSNTMDARIDQAKILSEIIESVTQTVSVPVIAKISPQADSMVQLVRAVEQAGASAVTLSHRFQGLMIDIEKKEPLSSALFGYGGPWMLPLVLGHVSKVAGEVQIPVCGSGGIWNWRNVLQVVMAGATTVQMTTAFLLQGFDTVSTMLDKLMEFCRSNGYANWEELVGCALGKKGHYDRFTDTARVRIKDPSLCRQCNAKPCIEACLFDAIKVIQDGSIEISENCTACGFCLQMCPYSDALVLAES